MSKHFTKYSFLVLLILCSAVFAFGCFAPTTPNLKKYSVSTTRITNEVYQSKYKFTFSLELNNPTDDDVNMVIEMQIRQSFSLTDGWKPTTQRTFLVPKKSTKTFTYDFEIRVNNNETLPTKYNAKLSSYYLAN